MVPWLWMWSPQINLPGSGDVVQDIEPITSWFGNIKPEAGNAAIEEKAFAIASYGKQLGLITEVLVELAEQRPVRSPRGAKALADLKSIQAAIEAIKLVEYERELAALESRVAVVRRKAKPEAQANAKVSKRRPAPSLG